MRLVAAFQRTRPCTLVSSAVPKTPSAPGTCICTDRPLTVSGMTCLSSVITTSPRLSVIIDVACGAAKSRRPSSDSTKREDQGEKAIRMEQKPPADLDSSGRLPRLGRPRHHGVPQRDPADGDERALRVARGLLDGGAG